MTSTSNIESLILDLNKDNDCHFTDISGPPGIGKSRLLLSSLKNYLTLFNNSFGLLVDCNGDINLIDNDDSDRVNERMYLYI